jgi:hypothetical protein
VTGSADAFGGVVLEGTMLDRGMASFREVLDAGDTEAIRAFIAFQANQ